MDDFYAKYGVRSFVGGNTGVQMGGWFRKEINTLADIKGVKFRVAGLAGKPWAKLGAVPQQIPGGDIYPALEKGTIDAAEWVGPYDDEKLGFYKVAKHYYYPGWWEPGPVIHFFVALKEWDKLPAEYKAAFEAAAFEANVTMMAEYDHKNPAALSRLLGNGVKLHKFSPELMQAFHKASFEVYAEESEKSPDFKKISTEYFKYAKIQNAWFSVAESSLSQFLHSK
jgi:TRAP-type mannitol/chloroaromatic compound transport system substrate-binding protein